LPSEPPTQIALADLAAQVVRRIAWGGDGRRGTARLEIGAGSLAGAVVQVETEGSEVSVDLELPVGVPGEALSRRLAERLSARGLRVRSICSR
jgi:hypothetical protein